MTRVRSDLPFEHSTKSTIENHIQKQASDQTASTRVHFPFGETMMKEEFGCDITCSPAQSRATPILPPCRVCDENASGFHYGVNTCEACKGFFRRSMLRREKYKCLGNGNCDITLSRRNGCPYCRYKKCLSVGMSKHAIKTGRYTHKKRTQDILEIQKIRDGTPLESEDTSLPVSPHPAPWQDRGHQETEALMQTILDAHNKYVQSTLSLSEDTLEKNQQAYYEQYKLKVDMFGPMTTLPREQYDEIYQSTGIDIDNRQEMMRAFAASMEAGIRRYISFVKAVPGFTVLSSDDQANLIKGARFEFFFLGSFRGYNSKLNVLSTSSGKCLHLHEICKIWDEDFMLEAFNFADSLKALKLSVEECVVIKTLCILFTDRCDLAQPEKVEEIQWKVIRCLILLQHKYHSKPMIRFAKIIDRLTAVRSLTEWNNKIAKSLYLWPAVQQSPLLLDMLAT
ncbi:LOW QUALITY PROTEIN: nuclear receptor subfamily 1 group D member 2-like [Haliotis rubra]|uniref:LOW QUALITY PROTEIN: nuclear receptor subfamily 1 group D member 2-like n=1 Tax=Haliotis rubra TaxID=36100 RepID=UPI001EE54739|nr:LOW QUALITY PROTEIN: nuclear receptor subfamily 1 group D member 2-like [Haliotis rubra]